MVCNSLLCWQLGFPSCVCYESGYLLLIGNLLNLTNLLVVNLPNYC